jgi:hypothetical protein
MKIFADLHHGELYHSLHLLFEKRLGFELYRPVGMEWYHEGYWHVFPHINTARQYLDLYSKSNPPKDVHGNELSPSARVNHSYSVEDGIHLVNDPTKDDFDHKAITLDKFKSIKFDIIIASMPGHIAPFQKLIKEFQPQAKLVFQIGNPGWPIPHDVHNVLCSTSPKNMGNKNSVCYHQEFDLDLFKYEPPTIHNEANSYIHWMTQIELLNQYKAGLPDWTFKTYGAGMEGHFQKTTNLAKAMIKSGWTWHMKELGDGFGHVLHNTYACGRPAIINTSYYHGMIGGELLEDKVTCIDLGKRTIEENLKVLQEYSDPEKHLALCENAYKRFSELVNYEEEGNLIKKFIERLR